MLFILSALLSLTVSGNVPAVTQLSTTLDNGQIRIVITPVLQGVRPGSLLEFTDLATGVDLAGGLQFGGVQSDVFIPYEGEITCLSDTEAIFTSPYMYDHTGNEILPISVSILYRLNGRGLEMIFGIEASFDAEIMKPLEVDFTMTSWSTAEFRNQTTLSDRFIDFSLGMGFIRISGDQSVLLTNSEQPSLTAQVLFPNPSKANLIVTSPPPPADPYLTLRFFDAEPPRENCLGPDLHSVIPAGDVSSYYAGFFLNDDAVPVFLSDHPDGYERTASWILDEIPMIHPFQGYIWGFSTSPGGPEPVTAGLIQLMEDHPEMKMNWLVLPDGILTGNRDSVWFEPGYEDSWSHWHCTWRISTEATPEFRQWLINIQDDVYSWADRVNLGSHGYHHTPNPDSSFGEFHEFITFEPEEHLERFMMISSDIIDMGLDTAIVNRTIRYPGHRTSLSGLWATIAEGFDFYCNGIRWYEWNGGELFLDTYITKFQTPAGRIWGTNTVWWADWGSPYEDSLLSTVMNRGKHGLLGGHPIAMLAGGTLPEAYARLDSICTSLETEYDNFGWLFPIEYGDFLEECYGITWNGITSSPGQLTVSFTGQATSGQTMVLLLPDGSFVEEVLVDNEPIGWELRSNWRLFVILPVLSGGEHTLHASWTITGIEEEEEEEGIQPVLTITNPVTTNLIVRASGLTSSSPFVLSIFDLSGRLVLRRARLTDNMGGLYESFEMNSQSGAPLPGGLYVVNLQAGSTNISRSFVSL
jgi:hypothetical protein